MIRLFNVYYSTRTIVLLLCEALIVSGCFLLATVLLLGPDTYLVLNYEYGGLKILGLTILTLLCSYYFDLYEPQRISARWEIYFRLLLVLGFLSFLLSAIIYEFPTVVSPLSKQKPDEPDWTERFEIYAGQMEISNGFSDGLVEGSAG